jgi:hypothetical protein
VVPHLRLTAAERLQFWNEGIAHFNDRRFWHAHESWERGWLELPEIEKLHVQSLIQFAGVFDLISKGRTGGALSLARLALQKVNQVQGTGLMNAVFPRLEIPGIHEALELLSRTSESELPEKVSRISLKAQLLLSRS